jgi:hypothetical protein
LGEGYCVGLTDADDGKGGVRQGEYNDREESEKRSCRKGARLILFIQLV